MELTTMTPGSKRERVFEVVRMKILTVLDEVSPESIGDRVRLADLGANSLDRADIAALAIEELELTFPLRELADIKDIGGLVDALTARLP